MFSNWLGRNRTSKGREKSDWSIPFADEWVSLWACLHDAGIRGAEFDSTQRVLTLDLECGFPAPPQSSVGSVEMRIFEVTHLLVFVDRPWPGKPPEHSPQMSRDDWEAVQSEYRAKSVAASVDFVEFQNLC